MRKPEEIRADIEKLTKELEVVKIHESRQVAAVNILYNLGWTHDPHKGWKKPAPNGATIRLPEGWRLCDLGGWDHWWYSLHPQCRRQVCSGVSSSCYYRAGC